MKYSYDLHADAVIQTYGLKQKSGKEHGDKPCPNCGGTDRFWINEHEGNLMHHCRKECDFSERQAALQRDGALPIDAYSTPHEEHRNSEPTAYHLQKRIYLQGSGAICDGNTVVIELFDILSGEPRGQQFIKPDGSKKFSSKLQKEGTGALIGSDTDMLYLLKVGLMLSLFTEQRDSRHYLLLMQVISQKQSRFCKTRAAKLWLRRMQTKWVYRQRKRLASHMRFHQLEKIGGTSLMHVG